MPLAPKIIPDLQQIVGAENVLTAREDLIPYSFDGTAAMQTNARLRCLRTQHGTRSTHPQTGQRNQNSRRHPRLRHGIERRQFASADCIVLCLVKMDKILELDRANLTMLVETGRDDADDCRCRERGRIVLSARSRAR